MRLGKFIKTFGVLFILGMQSVLGQEIPHQKLTLSCDNCHQTETWQKVSFDHTTTNFELTGEHKKIDCVSCHDLADFSRVQANCKSCHFDVHHDRLYPDCGRCHTTRNWILLDPYEAHRNTSFQLIGRHASLDCWACHRGEVENGWRRVFSNCSECHLSEYRSATDPVHDNLGFGFVCENCHSLFSWKPASFRKHDTQYFPIFSGAHAGIWESCSICHDEPADYTTFSCFLNCHEHSQAKTDSKHDEVSDYRYDSDACYECHRTGKGED